MPLTTMDYRYDVMNCRTPKENFAEGVSAANLSIRVPINVYTADDSDSITTVLNLAGTKIITISYTWGGGVRRRNYTRVHRP